MVLVGGTVALMAVLVSFTDFRIPRLRPLISGEPVIVLQDGKPIERNLRRNRMTVEELAGEARQNGGPLARRVAWAILEPNGRVSIIER